MSERKILQKIKQNPVYLTLTIIVGAILLLILMLYLTVPSYRFDESQPFHGDFIFNPYQEVDSNHFVKPIYIDFRSDSIEKQGVSSYEYGFAMTGTRFLCIGYKEKRKIDYPFLQSIHYKQFNLDKLNEMSRLVAPAHPSKGFKKGEMTNLDHYRIIEVLTKNCNSLYFWDIALSNGHRCNIIATEENFGFFTACLSENEPESIYKSLDNGNSYGVYFNDNIAEVPVLEYVTIENDTLSLSTSAMAKEIRFIGQNAVVKMIVNDVSKTSYVFQKDDSYIRTEIEFKNGNTLYLNPLVRHPYQYFFDQNNAHVMKGRTYLMWGMSIIVVIALMRYFVIKLRDKR